MLPCILPAGLDDAEPGMRTLALILEYDGSDFSGWQLQPGKRTVHAVVRDAIVRLVGDEEVVVHCSGRTDAGVHARYQVAHFHTKSSYRVDAFRGAVNHFLPRDVALVGVAEVPESFHARRRAVSKTYAYRILNRRQPSALDRLRVWHVVKPLDMEAMRAAARHLTGRHDFVSFQGPRAEVRTTVRTVHAVGFERQGDEIVFRIAGDGFLKQMVRNVIGTLVEVGLGQRSPEDIPGIISACRRSAAGMTAPPQGLYLERVYYPEPFESMLRDGLVFQGEGTVLCGTEGDFYNPHVHRGDAD